jgi:hypothetical protein
VEAQARAEVRGRSEGDDVMRMMNPQETILSEIADERMTHEDVAQTYAFCIRQKAVDPVDFGVVNRAIIERWSYSSLKSIKARAWRYIEG